MEMELRRLNELEAENGGTSWTSNPAPAGLVSAHNEERPVRALRDVAGDPINALQAAASVWEADRARGTAFAELAVTGRKAQRAFRRVAIRAGDLGPAGEAVIAYAHLVDAYLAAGPKERRLRAVELAHHKRIVLPAGVDAPWLAVAGEVDSAHRPVNVGVTTHAQHDVDVRIPDFPEVGPIATRYAVVGDIQDNDEGVVLLLHGLGSRLEEANRVAESLAGFGYGVVCVDLPSQGYSARVSPASFADPTMGTYYTPAWHSDTGYAYLSLNEAFIEAFVDALGLRRSLVAVGGGSLGGTLALRLAMTHRLGPTVRYVAWSPGSVWGTQQTNYVNWAAIEATLGTRLFSKELLAADDTRHADSRRDYISWVFDSGPPFIKKQPNLWFKGISGEADRILAARRDRRELYGFEHRIACLALAYEQTIYSICEIAKGDAVPRYARIVNPTLVIAGSRDDDALDIHGEVEKLAERMRRHGRRGRVVLLDACHSIHDERPGALAGQIHAFLRDPAMRVLA